MNKKSLLLLVVCCLNSLLVHLKAETITYDFSSTDYWVTESNGATHPGTGTSAQIKDIYYTVTNDCFVGNGEVYFDNEYLGASGTYPSGQRLTERLLGFPFFRVSASKQLFNSHCK
mgnify:CR=1 FL=1